MKLAPPRSLLGQFVALHITVAVVAVVTLFWSASALLHQTSDHFQRDLLRQQAALSIAAAGTSANAPLAVLANGMAVSIVGPDHRVRRSDGPSRPAIIAAAPLARTARFFRRGAVGGYSVPDGADWVVVSQDDADPAVIIDDIVRAFLPRFALIGGLFAALAALIGVLLARRLTLRMRAVSAIAATIGPRSLETRLPLGRLPLEAEPLAEATNAALDRLAAALHVQAAFAADVAHELRTPLAVIRLRADAVADANKREPILAAVDRAARVIAQLLALADLEQPHEGGAPIDLHALAEQVVADRAPAILASGRSISLERHGADAWLNGYPEALRLALENLVDNATRHTAPGTAITVSAGPGGAFAVSDDGLPVSDATLVKLKDRLWRGAAPEVEGSGIGLSIVERVAKAHDGTLVVRRGADDRGLTFVITMQGVR